MQAYMVQNKVNGKSYIGITTRSIKRRWYEHCCVPNSCGKLLAKAINKYGAEAFELTVIASAFKGLDNLKELEKQLILQNRTFAPNGYNLTLGGDGVFGFKHSEESTQRQRDRLRGKVCSEDTKQKMKLAHSGEKNHFFGRHHSEETKARISAAKRGSIGPRLGIPVSEETRRKISETLTGKPGRPHTAETKALMSTKQKAVKHFPPSEETRKKLSESITRSWIARRAKTLQGA